MKILLVDDDHKMVGPGLSVMLRGLAENIELTSTPSCEGAFALLETGAEFELVLMDLKLNSGLQGSEGIRKLREEYPDLPVVALSGADDSNIVQEALDAGAMGFIPKSATGDYIRGALKIIVVHEGFSVPRKYATACVSDKALATPPDLGLTPRQEEALKLLLKGKTNKAIAREMGIAEQTVKVYVSAALRVLDVTSRAEAIVAASEMRLVFRYDTTARTKYTCPGCRAIAWGKDSLKLICGACNRPMPAPQDDA